MLDVLNTQFTEINWWVVRLDAVNGNGKFGLPREPIRIPLCFWPIVSGGTVYYTVQADFKFRLYMKYQCLTTQFISCCIKAMCLCGAVCFSTVRVPLADLGEGPRGPTPSPLFWVKKEEMTEEEKPAGQINPTPTPLVSAGSERGKWNSFPSLFMWTEHSLPW